MAEFIISMQRQTSFIRKGWVHFVPALLLVFAITLSACSESTPEVEYIARVGDRLLTEDDLTISLDALPSGQDTAEALQQIVEEWVKNELIAQEAVRKGLRNDAEVQRLLEANERSVMVSTYWSKMFQDEPNEPVFEEIEAYYAQHADQLKLLDDYLRVRYLSTEDATKANEVRALLRDATVAGTVDSLWPSIVDRYASDAGASITLASNFYPESILFSSAKLRDAVSQLNPNQISSIINEGNAYHVVQLAARRARGTTPELSWIEGELKQRLTIESRKQMIARQVQRLRTEALAREDLEIRYLNE